MPRPVRPDDILDPHHLHVPSLGVLLALWAEAHENGGILRKDRFDPASFAQRLRLFDQKTLEPDEALVTGVLQVAIDRGYVDEQENEFVFGPFEGQTTRLARQYAIAFARLREVCAKLVFDAVNGPSLSDLEPVYESEREVEKVLAFVEGAVASGGPNAMLQHKAGFERLRPIANDLVGLAVNADGEQREELEQMLASIDGFVEASEMILADAAPIRPHLMLVHKRH